MSNLSRDKRIAIYLMLVTAIAALAGTLFFILSSGQLPIPDFSPVTTITPVTIYNYKDIATELTRNEGAVNLCLELFPNMEHWAPSTHLYYDDTVNPTNIVVTIFPEVHVLDDSAVVWFDTDIVLVKQFVPTSTGRKTVDPTSPSDYANILNTAITKNNGNRGYKASWIVTLTNNMPGNYTVSGHCEPIPY